VDNLINYGVPYDAGISWLVEALLTSKEGPFSVDFVCFLVGWLVEYLYN